MIQKYRQPILKQIKDGYSIKFQNNGLAFINKMKQ